MELTKQLQRIGAGKLDVLATGFHCEDGLLEHLTLGSMVRLLAELVEQPNDLDSVQGHPFASDYYFKAQLLQRRPLARCRLRFGKQHLVESLQHGEHLAFVVVERAWERHLALKVLAEKADKQEQRHDGRLQQ